MDQGVPSLRNSRNITFSVSDINEFRPTFSSADYSAIALSTAPPGTPLLTVSATDGDAVDNTITYTLTNQEGNTVNFSVDSNGVIRNEESFPNTNMPAVSAWY